MGRLTKRNKLGGAYYPYCFEKCDGEGTSEACICCEFESLIAEKLASYEDIMDEPEKLNKLLEVYLEKCDEVERLKMELIKYRKVEGMERENG